MKNLKINQQTFTPLVELNYEKGEISFEGRSIIEDPSKFYYEVYEWVQKYVRNPQKETKVIFKMDYMNTSSSKIFYNIIKDLGELENVKFTIICDEDDEDMIELFKTFEYSLGLDFYFLEVMF